MSVTGGVQSSNSEQQENTEEDNDDQQSQQQQAEDNDSRTNHDDNDKQRAQSEETTNIINKPSLSSNNNNNNHDDVHNQQEEEDGNKISKNKPPPLRIMDGNNQFTNQHQQRDSQQSGGGDSIRTPVTPGPLSAESKRRQLDKERKIGHRRVDEEGQVTYKKFPTTQIMGSIQLGIGYAVGSLASKPERDLLMKDFMEIELVLFNKEGSNTTPAHHYSDFKFKVYAPIAFRYFRDLFGIQPDDYLLSLCNEPLRELSNPGASGSVFYLTHDDNFIIKTVQHKEAEFLLKLLPGYYMNLNQNPRTLLPKFFGQYCYICGGKNIRFVVMNNLLPSFVRMHQKYDLKGSTYKRKANKYERKKESPTYKDLDFMEHHPEGIFLEVETYNALIKTMQRDCRVLESFKIMDYSLLVGVHNLDLSAKEKEERHKEQAEAAALELSKNSQQNETNNTAAAAAAELKHQHALNRSKSINKQRIAAYSTALESIQADVDPIDNEEDIPPGGIPARNSKGERLLLYIGIIDILQSYRLRKKLEHTWKSVLHDGDTISVHRPSFYAQRFMDFMSEKVFRKIPSLDLPEIKGPHRKFRNLVSSYIGLALKPPTKKLNNNNNNNNSSATSANNNNSNTNNQANTNATTANNNVKLQSQQQQQPSPQMMLANVLLSGRNEIRSSSGLSGTNLLKSNAKNVNIPKTMTTNTGHHLPPMGPQTTMTTDNSKYLRTAVIKQAAAQKQQSIIVSSVSQSSSSSSHDHQNLDNNEQCTVSSTGSSFTSGIGSTTRTITWTPPHSIGTATPTHTEGTPSLTESSESEYSATPLRHRHNYNKNSASNSMTHHPHHYNHHPGAHQFKLRNTSSTKSLVSSSSIGAGGSSVGGLEDDNEDDTEVKPQNEWPSSSTLSCSVSPATGGLGSVGGFVSQTSTTLTTINED